jgi:uncharacterized protein (DUF2147 family)
MLKSLIAATLILSSTAAFAAEPIVGKWKAPGGGIVNIAPCSSGFCATVISGQHKGKDAGTMNGSGAKYEGTVTDPRDNNTYSGSADVQGDKLNLTGCALKILCKTQVWVRV